MAIKNRELVPANRAPLDLAMLAQYILAMNDQPAYLPPPQELVKQCRNVLSCLSRTEVIDDEEIWEQLQIVEDFLIRAVNTGDDELRKEIMSAVLDKFYEIITDPESEAQPATALILNVFVGSGDNAMLSAARSMVQQAENTPGSMGLRASLSCLYRWVCQWNGTPALSDWVLAYIQALEEKQHMDLLLEISLENMERLFLALDAPPALRQSVAEVVFHVLACMRMSLDALDCISPHVGRVLVNLASDSSQYSRQLLQTVVDILTSMVEHFTSGSSTSHTQDFKDKYAVLISLLERHMTSRDCRYLQNRPWIVSTVARTPKANSDKEVQTKVGLYNMGNTCYMNSVIQALFVSKQFSYTVMTRMNGVPYWSRLGALFSKILYSLSTKIYPLELYYVPRSPYFGNINGLETCKFLGTPVDRLQVGNPPFFQLPGRQHDSYEFLGYLFEMLQAYENYSEEGFDYAHPPNPYADEDADKDNDPNGNGSGSPDPGPNPRSSSPRPSGSGSSTSCKRSLSQTEIIMPPKKRLRTKESKDKANKDKKDKNPHNDPSDDKPVDVRKNSVIDKIFGGVLLTRLECAECGLCSVSRDVFRDLQLSFPEKLEGFKLSVQSLLEYYFSEERLEGDNMYRCSDCNKLREADRTVVVEVSPKYLILVLKNFRYEAKIQMQTKLMHAMHYDLTIGLPAVRTYDGAGFCMPKYHLYAAVIHAGLTLDSGHYFTMGCDEGNWYRYDDDSVSGCTEVEMNTLNNNCTPYILFYRRADVIEPPKPGICDLPPMMQTSLVSHNKHVVDSVQRMKAAPQRP